MLSRNLEKTLHRALAHANERRHEYATLEHMHDEFHRRVVVIEQQHLVHRRLLRLGLALDNDAGLPVVTADSVVIAHRPTNRSPTFFGVRL